MRAGWGVVLIFLGLTVGLVAAVLLRTRLPRMVVVGLLVASGAAVGTGALLVQPEASGAEWALTLAALGVMAPFQARLIFGRLGKTEGPSSGTVVPD